MAQKIEIEDMTTVGALAEKLMLPVSRLITELMKNGVMATVNERIDFDTAQIIVADLGVDIELTKKEIEETLLPPRAKRKISEHAIPRPPVVAVMGHVDHGKTTLLDSIRGSEVVKREAGGITQHISACQVNHNGRMITFLDTPGHEAFAAIREHGAFLTDVVVIVVAADDGVKPQTVEAIRFARKADAKIVVAINKIDKEGADPNHTKQQLAEQDLLVEEWGGDVVAVEVSAKNKQGLDNLLDMILLVADVEDLRAETAGPAQGLIIESHVEPGRGPIAHALVEAGTLKRGDYVLAGSSYAKIRNLESPEGKALLSAMPSTPVVITGFKTLPEFGDQFEAVANEKTARSRAEAVAEKQKTTNSRRELNSSDLIRIIDYSNKLQAFNVIIKADVRGSLTSVIDSLKAVSTEEVAARVVSSGVGLVTENDVHLAQTSGATIYAFNVSVPSNIKRLANRDKVSIRSYKVIYELIDDAKSELSDLLAPRVEEKELGKLKVKGVFKTTKTEVICGGEVIDGKLVAPSLARIRRGKDEIAGPVEVTNLKRGPQDAKEVVEGEMCGVNIKTDSKLELQENDVLEFFTRETIERSL